MEPTKTPSEHLVEVLNECRLTLEEGDDVDFIASFSALADRANVNAHNKGFYEKPQETGTRLMLMVTEIAEACDADRKDLRDDKIPEFLGLEAELADCIIRIMDFSAEKDLRVAEAVVAKMKFNKTRDYLHGNKKY